MVAKESRFQTDEAASACMGSEACGAVADSIRTAPLTAVLMCFGAGLAIGCMVAHGVIQAPRRRELSAAQRLGESVLQALGGMMPEAVSKRFAG